MRENISTFLLCEDNLDDLNLRYLRKCSSALRSSERDSQNRSENREKIRNSMEFVFNHINDNENDEFTIADFES